MTEEARKASFRQDGTEGKGAGEGDGVLDGEASLFSGSPAFSADVPCNHSTTKEVLTAKVDVDSKCSNDNDLRHCRGWVWKNEGEGDTYGDRSKVSERCSRFQETVRKC